MPIVVSRAIPRAARPHTCIHCAGGILQGAEYVNLSIRNGNEWASRKLHLNCEAPFLAINPEIREARERDGHATQVQPPETRQNGVEPTMVVHDETTGPNPVEPVELKTFQRAAEHTMFGSNFPNRECRTCGVVIGQRERYIRAIYRITNELTGVFINQEHHRYHTGCCPPEHPQVIRHMPQVIPSFVEEPQAMNDNQAEQILAPAPVPEKPQVYTPRPFNKTLPTSAIGQLAFIEGHLIQRFDTPGAIIGTIMDRLELNALNAMALPVGTRMVRDPWIVEMFSTVSRGMKAGRTRDLVMTQYQEDEARNNHGFCINVSKGISVANLNFTPLEWQAAPTWHQCTATMIPFVDKAGEEKAKSIFDNIRMRCGDNADFFIKGDSMYSPEQSQWCRVRALQLYRFSNKVIASSDGGFTRSENLVRIHDHPKEDEIRIPKFSEGQVVALRRDRKIHKMYLYDNKQASSWLVRSPTIQILPNNPSDYSSGTSECVCYRLSGLNLMVREEHLEAPKYTKKFGTPPAFTPRKLVIA